MPFLRDLFIKEELQWFADYPRAQESWGVFGDRIFIESSAPDVMRLRLRPRNPGRLFEGFNLRVFAPPELEVKITAPTDNVFYFDSAILVSGSELCFSVRVAEEGVLNRLLIVTRVDTLEEFTEALGG